MNNAVVGTLCKRVYKVDVTEVLLCVPIEAIYVPNPEPLNIRESR